MLRIVTDNVFHHLGYAHLHFKFKYLGIANCQ